MNEHHYQRIDKGVKRLKHSQVENEARQRARSDKGTFLPEYPPEIRSQVILEACEGLQRGYPTPEVIAVKHNIPRSTVYSWLLVDPRASHARDIFFAERIGLHLERIELSSNPLDLARGREAYRAWADIASKRDPANYGIKQEITHISADLGDRLRRARERVIEGQIVNNSETSGDKASQECDTSVMSNPPALPKK